MYNTGSLVTLVIDKIHGDNLETALRIRRGICGMIVRVNPGRNEDNTSYVVDFGPEGQWQCAHRELLSDSQEEGWEDDNNNPHSEGVTAIPNTGGERYADFSVTIGNGASMADEHRNEDPYELPEVDPDLDKEIEKRMEEIMAGKYE